MQYKWDFFAFMLLYVHDEDFLLVGKGAGGCSCKWEFFYALTFQILLLLSLRQVAGKLNGA